MPSSRLAHQREQLLAKPIGVERLGERVVGPLVRHRPDRRGVGAANEEVGAGNGPDRRPPAGPNVDAVEATQRLVSGDTGVVAERRVDGVDIRGGDAPDSSKPRSASESANPACARFATSFVSGADGPVAGDTVSRLATKKRHSRSTPVSSATRSRSARSSYTTVAAATVTTAASNSVVSRRSRSHHPPRRAQRRGRTGRSPTCVEFRCRVRR
ncbi:hypothetical protein [Halobaculum halobium]|uniref:hypothetical protein n=1 Tax=Halobaculum halobium TaxID=3032281 RepID=UPI0036F2F406